MIGAAKEQRRLRATLQVPKLAFELFAAAQVITFFHLLRDQVFVGHLQHRVARTIVTDTAVVCSLEGGELLVVDESVKERGRLSS